MINIEDWKCPKCGTENDISDSVQEIAENKTIKELDDELIDVPVQCDKCGFEKTLLVAVDLGNDSAEVDFESTKLNDQIKKRFSNMK